MNPTREKSSGGTRWGRLAARTEAATPAHRDRAADALRAVAIVGVVLGHWLVTAFTDTGDGLAVRSPLASMPGFAWVSWLLQTLAVFFLVGGYAGARSLGATRLTYAAWLRGRLSRLFRPAAVLVGVWAVAALVLVWAGLDLATLRGLVKLVFSPLWFLLVYALLTALTPLVVRLWRVARGAGVAGVVAVVAAVDVGRFALDGPGRLGWVNIVAGWLVPYALGVAWAEGAFRGRRAAAWLLVTGAAATAGLVAVCGYPASMVGVPGAEVSNLNPPTSAVVAFGVAQTGLALLVRPLVGRLVRRPGVWAVVVLANLSAMTVFLWHQTAMMGVTLGGRTAGVLPGLHTAPDHAAWLPERMLWLPLFAVALAGLWAVFHRWERRRAVASGAGRTEP